MFSLVLMFFLYEEPFRKGPIPILLFVLCLQIWGKINWTKNTTLPELQSDGEQCPSSAGWCQTTPGHIWPRRHEAGRGRKVKSAAGGKERNTRVGIVGILAAQPAQLPVICFVVNSDSCRGAEGGGVMTDRAAGHKSPSVPALSARPAVQILCVCAWIVSL